MAKVEFSLGELSEGTYPLLFSVKVKKTLSNQLRFWLFFKFFPFELRGWTED